MCLGGGTTINGGLVWRTPELILRRWNKSLDTNKFSVNNLSKYFNEIENNLGLDTKHNTNIDENKESLNSLR